MTVKDLILELHKHDPEMIVMGAVIDHTDWSYKVDDFTIEEDDPTDESGEVGIEYAEAYPEVIKEWNETAEFNGPKVLIIDLGQI